MNKLLLNRGDTFDLTINFEDSNDDPIDIKNTLIDKNGRNCRFNI